MIVVPVTHDLIHVATVDTARLSLSLLDEVAEERGAWRKRQMVDVAVQRLVHSEHEPSHTTSFPHAAHPRGSDCVMRPAAQFLESDGATIYRTSQITVSNFHKLSR